MSCPKNTQKLINKIKLMEKINKEESFVLRLRSNINGLIMIERIYSLLLDKGLSWLEDSDKDKVSLVEKWYEKMNREFYLFYLSINNSVFLNWKQIVDTDNIIDWKNFLDPDKFLDDSYPLRIRVYQN